MRVLVTGGSQGIGRGACLRLATDAAVGGEGSARIAVGGLAHDHALDETLAELKKLGAEAIPVPGDLADPEVPANIVKRATDAFGGLDAVVSNAGITRRALLMDQTLETWDTVFAVNVRAGWLLARAAHPWLKDSKGSFVTVGSTASMRPHTGLGAYSPSKAALVMLTRLLAQEWGDDGIRVNCVSPGFVHTPQTAGMYEDADLKARREALVPLHQIGDAYDDIAGVIAFFVGPDSSYCTGQNVVADGGFIDSIMDHIPGRVSTR